MNQDLPWPLAVNRPLVQPRISLVWARFVAARFTPVLLVGFLGSFSPTFLPTLAAMPLMPQSPGPPPVAVEEPLPPTLVIPEEPLPLSGPVLEPLPQEVSEESVAGVSTAEPEVLRMVARWARAWSERRVKEYLSLYSSRLGLGPETSREAWEEERRRRILGPSYISVVIEDPRVQFLEGEGARVEFVQHYRSDRYQDSVRKSLTLALEREGWRIVLEDSRALELN